MSNFLKTFGLISFTLTLIAVSTVLFYESPNTRRLSFYNEDKIRVTCPDSPDKTFFQECFRKDLAKSLSDYTAMDTYAILKMISETERLDSFHLKSENDRIKSFILKYENLIIFAENSNNLTVSRNELSFYTFPLVPIARLGVKMFFKNELDKFEKSELKSFQLEQDNSLYHRLDRIQKRISKLRL